MKARTKASYFNTPDMTTPAPWSSGRGGVRFGGALAAIPGSFSSSSVYPRGGGGGCIFTTVCAPLDAKLERLAAGMSFFDERAPTLTGGKG